MKSGNGSRRVGFASIALVLGGSVMLLASQPQSSPVRAEAAIAPPAQGTACQSFWDTGLNGRGVGHENTSGIDINLYRNKNYLMLDLTKWTVIGGLENTSATVGSDAYPQLGPGAKACIVFKRRPKPSPPNAAEASIYLVSSGQTFPLAHALYCDHHPGTKPIWAEVPTDCPRLTLTVGRFAVTVTPPRGKKEFASQDAVLAALRVKLTPKVGPVQAAAIVKILGVNGAWYPCDSNGCCRAA